MQLQLMPDELRFVADILEQRDAEVQTAGPQFEQRRVSTLLEKIIDKDLGFSIDELEDLADILANFGTADLSHMYGVEDLPAKKAMLSQVIDRLTEARVMQ